MTTIDFKEVWRQFHEENTRQFNQLRRQERRLGLIQRLTAAAVVLAILACNVYAAAAWADEAAFREAVQASWQTDEADKYTWYGALKSPGEDLPGHHSLQLSGFSYHWDLENVESFHPGVGYTYRKNLPDKWGWQVQAGVLRNSFDNTSVYASYGEYYRVNEHVRVSINVGAATGYDDPRATGAQGTVMPFLMPALHAYGVNLFLNSEFAGANYTVVEW